VPDTQPDPNRMDCPVCGKPNRATAILCTHCGAILREDRQQAATRQLGAEEHRPEEFEPNGEMLLRVRHNGGVLRLRPQDYDREVIVGRRAGPDSAVDVDLTDHDAAKFGVSRQHMSVIYDPQQKRVHVADLESANGVFLNGQRLPDDAAYLLRDGDQLQLGEFVADVAFRHDPDA